MVVASSGPTTARAFASAVRAQLGRTSRGKRCFNNRGGQEDTARLRQAAEEKTGDGHILTKERDRVAPEHKEAEDPQGPAARGTSTGRGLARTVARSTGSDQQPAWRTKG